MGLVSACRLRKSHYADYMTLPDSQTFSHRNFLRKTFTQSSFHIKEKLRPCVITSLCFSGIPKINACRGSVEITGEPIGRVRYNVDEFSVKTC